MTTESALYRLMTWLTPTFPVGGFSYSHGLEWAVESGSVRHADALAEWTSALLEFGTARNDAILLAAAWRAAGADNDLALREVNDLAVSLASSRERHLETTMQGNAFVAAITASWSCAAIERLRVAADGPIAYPVAVGVTAAGHGIDLRSTLIAWLHGFVANQVSAGLRLIPLGQTDGQRILACLEPVVRRVAELSFDAGIDDLGGFCVLAEIAAMRHETQYTRLFRT